MMSSPPDHARLREQLAAAGQEHIYTFYHTLATAERDRLDAQVASLDWSLIQELVETLVKRPRPCVRPGTLEPAPYFPHHPADRETEEKYRLARRRGEELLRQGKVAAFVVAGGQGTRLGCPGPKGTLLVTPVRRKPLFQCFAEFIRAWESRCGCATPFYIMTSPANHAATVAFWTQQRYFGLGDDQVMFFPQAMLPAVDFAGKVLLESPASLALCPNGHGGSLLALHASGSLADMARRGIEQISYFQVDNPLVRCLDPLFIGLHDLAAADMSSKMLPKICGKEKVGTFCLADGKLTVIEYSDLPEDLAEQRRPDGTLRFSAGSIALHVLRRDFVERLSAGGFALPYHRAEKKVSCLDLPSGRLLHPAQPNAVKLETFIFDALPLARRSIIYETDRLDEFAPIKQLEGVDSLRSSQEITVARNAAWLEAAGVKVPRQPDGKADCVIEIAPSFALYPEDVRRRKHQIPPLSSGGSIYLA